MDGLSGREGLSVFLLTCAFFPLLSLKQDDLTSAFTVRGTRVEMLLSSASSSDNPSTSAQTEQPCCFLVPQALLCNDDVGRVRLTQTVPLGSEQD